MWISDESSAVYRVGRFRLLRSCSRSMSTSCTTAIPLLLGVVFLAWPLIAQTSFTEAFSSAPNYSNNWVVAGQVGTTTTTYTSGNFRIQAPAVCSPNAGITFRSRQVFTGDVDASFQLNHGGYGRTTVGLWSANTNQLVIQSILDTNDTAYLNFGSGSNFTEYTYSSGPYMNRWITLRIQVVGNQVNFYADNGGGAQLLKTWPVPTASLPDAYYLTFGAASVCWKAGANDTSFRLIQASGAGANAFLYAANYLTNNISAYSINPSTGTLVPAPGSPFAGGSYPSWIAPTPSGRFAYVTNTGGNNVSGYAIHSATGALTPVTGSPFPAGGAPYGAAVDPSGKFLYANNFLSNDLWGYKIAEPTGALTPVPGNPFPSGPYPVYNVVFHPNGRFVYNPNLLGGTVSGFSINSITGTLTPLAGSPFPVGSRTISVAMEPQGKYLYATVEGVFGVYAFNVDATSGGLSPVPGSPFTVGLQPQWMAVDPTSRFLFAASINNNSVMGLAINQTNGALSAVPGSPFGTGAFPGIPAIDPSGTFLYVGNNGSNDISGFRIDRASGTLSPVPGSPFQAGGQPVAVAIVAPGPAPVTGTINVTTNLAAAAFTVNGPTTYSASGNSFSQPNAVPGVYNIAFGDVACYQKPLLGAKTLSAGGSILFDGRYSGIGSLTVSVTPALASRAKFSITPPIAGFPGSAPSPLPPKSVPAGRYRIVFDPLDGWIAPPPQDMEITPCGTVKVTGAYTAPASVGTGTLKILTNKDAARFTISSATSPRSVIRGSGKSFESLPVPEGTYFVQYEASVPGHYAPLDQRIRVEARGVATLNGFYRKLALVAFTGFNNAPTPSDCGSVVKDGRGAGDTYIVSDLNQNGMGIGKLVLSALGTSQIKAGLNAQAFTFYESGNGWACHAPFDESDHRPAGAWLATASPGPDDRVVVIGHSYGGNRARLFEDQARRVLGRPIDLLATIDPIDWTACSIGEAFKQGQVGPLCSQTDRVFTRTRAIAEWSFFQTIGQIVYLPSPLDKIAVALRGYTLASLSFQRPRSSQLPLPAEHIDIDDFPDVQRGILNMLTTVSGGARIVPEVEASTRTGSEVALRLTLSCLPVEPAPGLRLKSATLNGVSVLNLADLPPVGDLNPNESRGITLSFPISVGASGANGILTLTGENASGQTVVFSTIRLVLP